MFDTVLLADTLRSRRTSCL